MKRSNHAVADRAVVVTAVWKAVKAGEDAARTLQKQYPQIMALRGEARKAAITRENKKLYAEAGVSYKKDLRLYNAFAKQLQRAWDRATGAEKYDQARSPKPAEENDAAKNTRGPLDNALARMIRDGMTEQQIAAALEEALKNLAKTFAAAKTNFLTRVKIDDVATIQEKVA